MTNIGSRFQAIMFCASCPACYSLFLSKLSGVIYEISKARQGILPRPKPAEPVSQYLKMQEACQLGTEKG